MEAYLLDWVNLLLRWLHVIVAIAWIGSSFYFVLLDNNLEAPTDEDLKRRGVDGELWAVHGGGFYNPQKYFVGPRKMPPNKLHWFYWEAYSTWLTGFALFCMLYLWNASNFLVDKRVFDWSPQAAGFGALAYLVAGWFVYDIICRVFGRNKDGSIGGDLRVGILIFIYVVAATWIACHLFAGRAAFLMTGAMLGTIMSANVFFWIIPGQKKVVAQLTNGQPVEPIHGQRGKQRSLHNTYFTLPVLIAMLSNHYSMLFQHSLSWLVLVLLMLMGALIRAWFVLRHKGKQRMELWLVSGAILLGLVWMLRPQTVALPAAASTPVPTLAQVHAISQQRCVMCHNEQLASKNVMLHTPELLEKHASLVHQQVVLTRAMPMNNATGLTEQERQSFDRWFNARGK
jgi:uncharacterized membrane protein